MKNRVSAGLLLFTATLNCVAPAMSNEPTSIKPGAASQTGPSQSGTIVGQMQSTFDVVMSAGDRRVQIKVYTLKTGREATLAYIPPVEIDLANSLASYEDDTGSRDVSLIEFGDLYRGKMIPKETQVTVTLQVRLSDSLAIRRAVLKEAHGQGNYDLSQSNGDSKRLNDMNFILAKSQLVAVRSIELRLTWAGLPELSLKHSDSPALSSILSFQGQASASLVERMTSKSGVEVQAVFYPLIKVESEGIGRRKVDVNDVAKRVFKELGRAGTSLTGQTNPSVFIDRDVANRILRNSDWKDSWEIESDTLELLNSVLQLLQQQDFDGFATTQDEADEFLRQAYDWAKLAEEPGYVNLVNKLDAGEQLNEQDREWLDSHVSSFSRSSNGGGGISIGPMAFAGGGGSTSAGLDSRTTQGRDYAKAFKSWLNSGNLQGKIPVPPNLNLMRIDEQKLTKRIEQNVSIKLRASPYVAPASFSTNTSSPTIRVKLLDEHLEAIHRAENIQDRVPDVVDPTR